MKQFGGVLREINRTLNELMLFENIINTVLIFLAFYLISSFFRLSFIFSVIPAAAYLIVLTYLRMGVSKARMVEDKYAPLKEKLRTAADNISKDNVIIDELEYEVTNEMKGVGLSLFINPRNISYKILAATFLSFLIIFTSTFNIQFPAFKKTVPDIFEKGIKGAGDFVVTKLNPDDDIYGEEDVAKLGDDELDIRIKPVDFKVSVKEEGSFQRREFSTIFPSDALVKESAAYEENIPKEQQELVKNYFKKLAG
ncbi:hypothetical protein HYU10_00995 [Candidatus Woesearchaeota archaeon]|nr:hypothetical protein [Candidatus Woesearchaeota archaeon]MBI2130324.1 hypothetical protein [Candidatus Woesearchaeota archaeon]MBI2660815.1 hypothetical protein [Candidatus Woesearchaeota archaeon]